MKEMTLHATLAQTSSRVTLAWLCTQLSLLVAEHETTHTTLPLRLMSQSEEEVLEVWLKDPSPTHDTRLCRYRRLALRPIEVSEYKSANRTREVTIAVNLLPAALIYTNASLAEVLAQDVQPDKVVADGWVLPIERLAPAQMRRMQQFYAVMDSKMVNGLHCPLRSSLHYQYRPNRYVELEKEVRLLLAGCFRPGGKAEGCPLCLNLQLNDVDASRLHSIDSEYRQLLFGDNYTAEDPREAFVEHGACKPSAKRTLRMVMLYPKGSLEAARRLCKLIQSLSGIIAVFPLSHEEGWMEYEMSSTVLGDIKDWLLHLKQRNYKQKDLLVCYLSPSGEEGVAANKIHLRTHVAIACRFFKLLFMNSIPCKAAEGKGLEKNAANLASGLVVKLRGLSWIPRNILTQNTDLIICLSQLPDSHNCLRAATFCFNQEASSVCDFVCESHLFIPYFYSFFNSSLRSFVHEHNNNLPRRIVIYCHRNADAQHLKDFAQLLATDLPHIPLMVVCLRLTGASYPTFYDPSSPCLMPCDGTYISCPNDTYMLFCNDLRSTSNNLPLRYPHPLEVRLKCLKADGTYTPVQPAEADELMTQVYQLTNLNPTRVDRCVLPVIASRTDELLRFSYSEKMAKEATSSVTTNDGGTVAQWRSGAGG